MTRPPVPVICAHRPTVGGLVKPWVNVELADGGVDFRSRHTTRLVVCFRRGLCQVCGRPLNDDTHGCLFLGGPDQLRTLVFDEAPLHRQCAVYTSHACPMVAGRMDHVPSGPLLSEGARGKACSKPGCDCGGWVQQDGDRPTPTEPHRWYAVTVSGYTVAFDPRGELIGGLVSPDQVEGVRVVSEPGAGRCWERLPLRVALADYEPPDVMG